MSDRSVSEDAEAPNTGLNTKSAAASWENHIGRGALASRLVQAVVAYSLDGLLGLVVGVLYLARPGIIIGGLAGVLGGRSSSNRRALIWGSYRSRWPISSFLSCLREAGYSVAGTTQHPPTPAGWKGALFFNSGAENMILDSKNHQNSRFRALSFYLLSLTTLIAPLLASCGPSAAALEATAQQEAANAQMARTTKAESQFAKQVAAAPTASPTSTPTATPGPTQPPPQAILESASHAVRQQESYHFQMDFYLSENGEAQLSGPYHMEGDFLLPDRFHRMTEVIFRVGEGLILSPERKAEIIQIGETTYINNRFRGAWEVFDDFSHTFGPDAFAVIDPEEIQNLTLVEATTLEGVTVYQLAGTLAAEHLGIEGEGLEIAYFVGTEDFLPRRTVISGFMTTEGHMMFEGSELDLVEFEAQMLFQNYGDPVSIAPPEIAPTAVPLDNILFTDDFSDPSSGWDRYNDSIGITDYDNNGYRIFVNESEYDLWANPGRYFTDVRVEVTAIKVGGSDDNDFGVICRYRDVNHYYFFIISSDGFYGIGVVDDGEQLLIGMPNMEFSNTINQGSTSNLIWADCVGETLTLYANGTVLVEVRDSRFTSGDVGLMAGTFGEPGTDILFDDFIVYGP